MSIPFLVARSIWSRNRELQTQAKPQPVTVLLIRDSRSTMFGSVFTRLYSTMTRHRLEDQKASQTSERAFEKWVPASPRLVLRFVDGESCTVFLDVFLTNQIWRHVALR
jgi:hypothetical protein